MVLGRLVHLGVDAMMVSTIFAGIKRSTGLEPDTSRVTEPTVRTALEKYFAAGDFLFESGLSFVQNSNMFRVASPELRLFGDASQSMQNLGKKF